MKEATGELNMTVIVIVAIAAMAAFFYAFVWPSVKVSMLNRQCETECGANNFKKATPETVKGTGQTGAAGEQTDTSWTCVCGTSNE